MIVVQYVVFPVTGSVTSHVGLSGVAGKVAASASAPCMNSAVIHTDRPARSQRQERAGGACRALQRDPALGVASSGARLDMIEEKN